MRRQSGSHPGDGRHNSRSRSRKGRNNAGPQRGASSTPASAAPRDRNQHSQNNVQAQATQATSPFGVTDSVKSGQQKAKEAMEKEKEKARLKKLEREKEQQQKQVNKEKAKTQKREAMMSIIEDTDVADAPTPEVAQASYEAEAKAFTFKNANVTADVVKQTTKKRHVPAEEIRKLFALLDRSGKEQISQRDVLVALKKQPAIRRLLGLPVANTDDGSTTLEARLLAIQDAFESGSGLGELSSVVDKMRGENSTFGWEAFLAIVQTMSVKDVAAAAALVPREHSTGPAFIATHVWQEVPEGAACPGGLEYKMDIATGKTLGRLMPAKARLDTVAPVTTRTLATCEG